MMIAQTFEKDEQADVLAMKDLIKKEPLEIAKALSERFSKRYGFEFGGYVRVTYSITDDIYTIECGTSYKENVDRGDFLQIPERVRFYREITAAKRKK